MWTWNRVMQRGSLTEGVRSEKTALHGTMLILLCSLTAIGSAVAYAQPAPPQPVPGQPSPAMTPAEAERAREAERLKQAERARAAEPEVKTEHKRVRPSETYVAGFGGYTFGGKLSNEGAGLLPGGNGGDRDLADSAVYGAKLGHFFGDRLDWLGVEMEAFNTTPHVEQQGLTPGTHLRVTTLAFNLIGRLKLDCEIKTVRTEPRSRREGIRYETHYEREFCRLQPYGGVGLGVFFANLSNNGSGVSDNAVPGLNALAGLRYYFNERVAMFGEYKYNWAALDLTNGPIGGLNGDYQANHLVGGLSFHF
jgi:hypothetical protein